MSAADHPTWRRIRNIFLGPGFGPSFLVRIVFPLAVMYFTRSGLLTIAAIGVPIAVVGLIDIYLRTRFTLRSLLLAILTLQVPIAILVTANSEIAYGIGAALLVLWLWIVGNRIELLIVNDSSTGGRWKKIDPDESPQD